ncbi:MAG: cadherin-like beta sandwich domain-containing protein, partial [Aphanocapsa feldmannii 277cV]
MNNVITRITSCYDENAALTDLTVNNDNIGFSSNQLAYTEDVDYSVSSVTLQATTNDNCGAKIIINGMKVDRDTNSEAIYLKPGENTIPVKFVNGPSTKEYTIAVTRAAAACSFESDIDDYDYRTGGKVQLSLPAASCGSGDDDALIRYYTLTSQQSSSDGILILPPGLTYNEDTRTISGTATGILEKTNYTWTAVNEHQDLTKENFSIQVQAAPTGITLSVEPTSVPEGGESDGVIDVTVTARVDDDATFLTEQTVTVTVGDANDTAEEGIDYREIVDSFDIIIPAGETEGSDGFSIDPLHDLLDEGDSEQTYETLTVSGTGSIPVTPTTLTITDDDPPSGRIKLTLLNDSDGDLSAVSEGAGSIMVKVKADLEGEEGEDPSTYAEDQTVTVTVGASGDTAKQGIDYTVTVSVDDDTATKDNDQNISANKFNITI